MSETESGFAKILIVVLTTIVATILLELIIIFGFIWFKNPFGLKDLLFQHQIINQNSNINQNINSAIQPLFKDNAVKTLNTTTGIKITFEIKKTLQSFGVDTSKLPDVLSPASVACLRLKIGDKRVTDLINGATPNALDFLKGKSCF